MKKKRIFTLIEIIIVIFIISLVTGAIGYSMKGTLDKGRAFRTEQAMDQLRDLILLCVAEGEKLENVVSDPIQYLKKYGLAKNPSQLVEDGWGEKFTIQLNRGKTDFQIRSEKLLSYKAKLKKESPKKETEEG